MEWIGSDEQVHQHQIRLRYFRKTSQCSPLGQLVGCSASIQHLEQGFFPSYFALDQE